MLNRIIYALHRRICFSTWIPKSEDAVSGWQRLPDRRIWPCTNHGEVILTCSEIYLLVLTFSYDTVPWAIQYNYSNMPHTTFYIKNLSEVYMHLSAAIFIDSLAISSALISVCVIKALAAHSANWPPDPTPITSFI